MGELTKEFNLNMRSTIYVEEHMRHAHLRKNASSSKMKSKPLNHLIRRVNSHCSSQTTICGTVQIEFFFETWSIWKVYPTLGYVQKISPLGPPWSEILRHFQFLWFLLYVVKHFITLEKIAAVRISRFFDTSP